MKKEFVSYEQALALKELGFDEECFGGYDIDKELYIGYENNEILFNPSYYIITPLKQQVFRWFREKHNIDFAVLEKYKDLGKFYGGYVNQNDVRVSFGSDFKTYEEAEDACIDRLIEIVKQK
jgi:hypothetical protein